MGEVEADVDHIGGVAGDDRRAKQARAVAGEFNLQNFIDHVDDFIDHQTHAAAAIGDSAAGMAPFIIAEHQHGMAGTVHVEHAAHRHQRHQAATILGDRLACGGFDLFAVDIFQAGDEAEWHRLGRLVAGAEQQHGHAIIGSCALGGVTGGQGPPAATAFHPAANAAGAGDAVRVQDHDHRAIPQDGVAGEHGDVAQDGCHRLDDDFLGIEDAVHDDAQGGAADLGDDDVDRILRRIGRGRGQAQQVGQADQRQQLVPQAQHRCVVDAFHHRLGALAIDAAVLRGAGAHQFDDADLRHGEAFATGFDDQGRHNGQGQRDFDGEGGALTLGGFQIDGATNLFDVGFHHIHAHATAGNGGDGGGGGEAGAHDEALHLGIGHGGEIALGRQAVGQRLGLDAVHRKAGAIIGNFDNDMTAFVEGVQGDAAGFRLAGSAALLRGFQTVIGGVADHMGQRVLDQFQHLPVELGIGAEHFQLDLFRQFTGEVAHQTRQLVPRIADRLHAGFHHPFLEV